MGGVSGGGYYSLCKVDAELRERRREGNESVRRREGETRRDEEARKRGGEVKMRGEEAQRRGEVRRWGGLHLLKGVDVEELEAVDVEQANVTVGRIA